MIYKPRCEYATTKQKGGALHCERVNGYCGFQYRCEQTGQWENTPTAKGCKARKPKEEEKNLSTKNHVTEMRELPKGAELSADHEFQGEEATVEKIAKKDLEVNEKIEKIARKSTMSLNEAAYAISDVADKAKTTIEPVSERSKVTDEVEQSENQTARRASGTKRGRRKKRDNVSSDAAQESTGGTADERLYPEGGTVSE